MLEDLGRDRVDVSNSELEMATTERVVGVMGEGAMIGMATRGLCFTSTSRAMPVCMDVVGGMQ